MRIIWCGPDGDDVTGDGSDLNPYQTIDMALTVFQDGDQIRLLAGVFIPTDTVLIQNKAGSIFSEDPGGATIQPEKTTKHAACVAILDSSRFSIIGVNITQASNIQGNTIGIYAGNVENFIAKTCNVSNFGVPSGDACGIYADGDGRIESCKVENFAGAGMNTWGIKTYGVEVIDCEATLISGMNNCIGIDPDGRYSP